MIYLQDRDFTLYNGDARHVLAQLEPGSVDCVITSPPYWGLRNYDVEGQIGLEETPAEYVQTIVQVFREVRRVLADHGTCWINLGDSYNNRAVSRQSSHQAGLGFTSDDLSKSWAEQTRNGRTRLSISDGVLKEKDLCMIPARVALALQADGWYLRSDIIWAKPNPMPESVTDRPTSAHEHVFLLTRQPRYWFDGEAVREPHNDSNSSRWDAKKRHGTTTSGDIVPGSSNPDSPYVGQPNHRGLPGVGTTFGGWNPAGRNIRNVWSIATQPYAEAHFATYPQELVRRCLLAGCPEWVCRVCGKPRERIVERELVATRGKINPEAKRDGGSFVASSANHSGGVYGRYETETLGWSDCGHGNYRPGVVLDPFLGSGTTAYVARQHARHTIGIELSAEYCELIAERTQQLSLEAELVV